MAKLKYEVADVLKLYDYTEDVKDFGLIKRYYYHWRRQREMPISCDVQGCKYYQVPDAEFLWNGKKIVPVMDHKQPNKRDNRPENLQLVCPNCASQLWTHCGGSKGAKEDLAPNAYVIYNPDESRYYLHEVRGGGLVVGGSAECKLLINEESKEEN